MIAQKREQIRIIDLIMIAIGCATYAFGLVEFNIANKLADGGISGITLIFRALFHIDPAYMTLIINIPLILIGYRFLGKRSLIYTIYGTIMLSFFLWVWQRTPIVINIHHDLILASIGAGLLGGAGSGLLYRFGGTTGGTDIIARIFERFKGVPMSQTLLWLDVVVLVASLVYIDVQHMAYTLIMSYIFSRIVNLILSGANSAKGVLIISSESKKITDAIMVRMQRGVSIIQGKGGYSYEDRPILYVVVSPSELYTLQLLVDDFDKQAFLSVLDVSQTMGEGFSYKRPEKKIFHKK